MKVDMDGFDAAFKEAQEKSRAGGKKTGGPQLLFEAEATAWLANNGVPTTDDSHKYAPGTNPSATVKILTLDGFKDSTEGVEGPIGLRARSHLLLRRVRRAGGGRRLAQVRGGSAARVTDTKIAAGFVLHSGGGVEGVVKVGDACEALVDYDRSNIAPNHTMTHVLNYAHRAVLSDGVDQKGSLVDSEKRSLTFPNKAIGPEEIERVEAIVREQVVEKLAVDTRESALAQAQAISGLRAVDEVYPDPVRVVSVGPSIDELLAEPAKEDRKSYSIEFCGGTHLGNTGEAEEFVILSEEGIAKGIRRVVGAM